MDWTKPSSLPSFIKETFMNHMLQIGYTEWEDDDPNADESITHFTGLLLEIAIEDHSIQGFDLTLLFDSKDHGERMEITMDFPPDDEDVVAQLTDDTVLHLLGNEATLVLQKIL